MSEITNFFFDPTYHQITAINMHTILIILLNIGILIGLYNKKIMSPTVTVVIFVVAIVVILLMNFLVRWLCRNNHENAAWGVVIVLYLLYIVTGYNYIRIMAGTKKSKTRGFMQNNESNYLDNYDESSDYSMSPRMSPQMSQRMQSQPMSSPMGSQYMPQSMQPPQMQSQPMQQMQPQMQPPQMQNFRMKEFENLEEE